MTNDPVAAHLANGFQLGEFEVRPSEGEVSRAGLVTRLDLKSMAVLVLLAEHAGRLTSKEDLLRAVWPDTVVEEVALARAVSELRRALGDDPHDPRYIETLHKRGYRLVAKVVPLGRQEVDGTSGLQRKFSALAVGGLVLLVAAIVSAVLVLAPARSRAPGPRTTGDSAMIVVLPLENLGLSEDAYFAAGLTEEITSRLAGVRGLRIISRTSATQYAGSGKTVPEIGEELGVDYVLEGSVLWDRTGEEPSRIRLTPQLIRVSDDTHIWSQVYDRELVDLFRLQTELARRVTENVGVEVLGEEATALESVPTDSLEAYQAYLRSLDAVGGFEPLGMEKVRAGVAELERAVELDPRFALAHARLSLLNMISFLTGSERTEAILGRAREAAETSLRLEPALGEGHLALGVYHFWGFRDYERALAEFAIARRALPNHSDLMASIAYIRRRQGRFDEAMATLAEARTLDPRNARIVVEVARLHHLLRQYARADQAYREALALDPAFTPTYISRGWLLFEWKGDTEAMRRAFEQSPSGVPPQVLAVLEYFAGNYEAALEYRNRGDQALVDAFRVVPAALFGGWVLELLNEPEQARADYESARRGLERQLEKSPQDYRLHMSLGLACAGLGRRSEAIEHGLQAVEMLPVSEDALGGPALVADLARLYAAVGDQEAALDQLEQLMSIPAGISMSVAIMEADPAFRHLRDQPRYGALISAPRPPHADSSAGDGSAAQSRR